MEKTEIEKLSLEDEKIETKNCFVKICENKDDHIAIFELSEAIKNHKDALNILKDSLVSVRESGNVSIRETQKVLTTLCKTIYNMNNFEVFLKETSYNVEHASEINEEKRALREMIKSASPADMSEFREFLKQKKEQESESELKQEPEN